MSLEMAHKVILPPKKNYIPQFLKQRDINSYYSTVSWEESDLGLNENLFTTFAKMRGFVYFVEFFISANIFK
jgi:hypothetical protein